MIKRTEYVLGFMFDIDRKRVLLIKKARPEWQKGRFNGLGGHIEEGESPAAAMQREFAEEADLDVSGWRLFCRLEFHTAVVHCFAGFTDFLNVAIQGSPEEPLITAGVNDLPANCIENVPWLVHMALSGDVPMVVTVMEGGGK